LKSRKDHGNGDIIGNQFALINKGLCLFSQFSSFRYVFPKDCPGFSRNITQAEVFWAALQKEKITLEYVIELEINREVAKKRIMGRRLCPNDNNHPNNINVKENLPIEKDGKLLCRVCGREGLLTRADDQDEAAIDKRHGIYFDTNTGTLAAVRYFKERVKVIQVDTLPGVREVSSHLFRLLT
jgi:adenylate kinase